MRIRQYMKKVLIGANSGRLIFRKESYKKRISRRSLLELELELERSIIIFKKEQFKLNIDTAASMSAHAIFVLETVACGPQELLHLLSVVSIGLGCMPQSPECLLR